MLVCRGINDVSRIRNSGSDKNMIAKRSALPPLDYAYWRPWQWKDHSLITRDCLLLTNIDRWFLRVKIRLSWLVHPRSEEKSSAFAQVYNKSIWRCLNMIGLNWKRGGATSQTHSLNKPLIPTRLQRNLPSVRAHSRHCQTANEFPALHHWLQNEPPLKKPRTSSVFVSIDCR